MLKRGILFGIILILSSFYVLGYGFDVSIEPIKTSIFITEGAEYKLTVKNNLDYENRYRIVVPDFSLWSVQTSPQSHRLSGMLIPANSEVSTTLKVYPTEKVWPGRYQIKIVVDSEKTDEEVRKVIDLSLLSGEYHQDEFKPEILITLELPNEGKLDPRQRQTIKVGVKNKNLLNIADLSLSLKSALIDEQKTGISLKPLEKKIEEFTFTLDSTQEPLEDSLIATVTVLDKTFTVVNDYDIIGFTESFQKEVKTEKSLLKTKQIITLTNPSNVPTEELYQIKTNPFQRLFTSSNPRASVVKDDAIYLEWKVNIPAQDSVKLEATVNYLPLVLIITIILIGTLSYYLFRSPLIVIKSVRDVKRKHDGISELSLMLTVKNRTKKPVSGIKLIDKVPNIIQVEKEFKIGTLHPSKITTHEGRGTIVTWNIESLEEMEERIITYSMRSKLSIVGKFVLPPASVKFKDKRDKIIVVHSNVLSLK